MSEAITRGIQVKVQAQYVPGHSDEAASRHLFAYTVVITNQGDVTAQLVSRHWIITNGYGKTEHVRGPGVVGEQPVLAAGESFSYTSACPLTTPNGSMRGSYQMLTEDGETFDAEVPLFEMYAPQALN